MKKLLNKSAMRTGSIAASVIKPKAKKRLIKKKVINTPKFNGGMMGGSGAGGMY